jgi:hypothetical protein
MREASSDSPCIGLPDHVEWAVGRLDSLADTMFASWLAQIHAKRMRQETFPVSRPDADLSELGECLWVRRSRAGCTTVLSVPTGLAMLQMSGGSAYVHVAGADTESVDRLMGQISEFLGAATDDESLVPMDFWATSQGGSRSAQRRIPAPTWAEIAANYESSTAAAIGDLLDSKVSGPGRLILWHGAPGTGKTYVLRALAREWSDWCSTHVITDPEDFLGAGTAYLLDVLTQHDRRRAVLDEVWKLIVLEDAGELLTEDAHSRTGQALSRLLNVTDGVLGQGMKTIVLVSTNEPLRRLHPAVRRSGRCLAQIEFKPLGIGAANAWLAARGQQRVTSPLVLADLYAIARGAQVEAARPFGFAAAV